MGLWEILMGEEPDFFETLSNYKNLGQFGEYSTEYALTRNNNLKGYLKVLHNVYLPNNGKTTEIDVLMIHEKGIYVFESKNYSGWIFGNADQLQWTQCLPNEKHYFYNPIKQNEIHCRALAAYLKIDTSKLTSYIVFSNRCQLKSVPPDTEHYKIINRHQMLKLIRDDFEQKPIIYNHQTVDDIYYKLIPLTHVVEDQKQQHIKAITERMSGSTCPFCGGKLILRNSKYGQFYGCSNYPKCKYTRNV